MKNEREEEKEQNKQLSAQERLTTPPDSSNLKREGTIFMSDKDSEDLPQDTGQGPDVQPAPIISPEPPRRRPERMTPLEVARRLENLKGKQVRLEEKEIDEGPELAGELTSIVSHYRIEGLDSDKDITRKGVEGDIPRETLREHLVGSGSFRNALRESGYSEERVAYYLDQNHFDELMGHLDSRLGEEEAKRQARAEKYQPVESDRQRVSSARAEMLRRANKDYAPIQPPPDADEETIKSIEEGNKERERMRKLFIDGFMSKEKSMEIGGSGMPESLEDLAGLIMKRESTRWRTKEMGGTDESLPLLDKNGKINKENFMQWVRSRMFAVHDFNPTSEVNFFGDEGMGVKTDYRVISFYEIVFTRSFWLERKIVDGKEVLEKDDDNEALRDQLLTEVFLFGMMRNGDLAYKNNRFSGEKMPQVLGQILSVNPMTRAKFMEFILTMPSMTKKSLGEMFGETGKEMRTKQERNAFMGEAIRRAFAAYMNITDYRQLSQILGEDADLFQESYTEYDPETGKEVRVNHITPNPQPRPGEDRAIDWYEDINGGKRLKVRDGKAPKDFMTYINFFTNPGPMPDQRRVTEVRERMVLSVMKKTGISYLEAKLAESWAYAMCGFTGIAGRNDTSAIGFDVWTKIGRLEEYRKRQQEEKRSGKYGNPWNMGIKRLGLTFLEASRDVYGRPFYEIIQGGQGYHIDIDGNPIKNTVSLEKRGKFIVLKDKDGNDVTDQLQFTEYREVEDPIAHSAVGIEYKTENGEFVRHDEDEYVPSCVVTDVDKPLRFNTDIQRQFVPNHISTSVAVYDFILNNIQTNFQEMVTYDSRGNPIVDHEKLDKIKEGIWHDTRYIFSTWGEIDYGAKIVTYEKASGESSEMTILQSMFENDVLWFIQQEANRRIAKSGFRVTREVTIPGTDEKGNDVSLTIPLASEKADDPSVVEDDFKAAVCKGVFSYLIAKEIAAHRTIGSGYTRYNLTDMKKIYDLLKFEEVLLPSEITDIQKDTKTKMLQNVWWGQFRLELAGGSLGGIWDMITTFAKTLQ